MNEEEAEEKKRIVFENSDFIAYIPYFSEYPYGVFIVSKLHKASLNDLDDKEKNSLAQALKVVTGSFDMIFDRPFPYMMAVHQTPVNSRDYKDSENYYHFHIEFYTPLFARDRIKYNASSETGAWASANIVSVTETARQTRTAKLKFLSKGYNTLLRRELIREFTALYGGKERGCFCLHRTGQGEPYRRAYRLQRRARSPGRPGYVYDNGCQEEKGREGNIQGPEFPRNCRGEHFRTDS